MRFPPPRELQLAPAASPLLWQALENSNLLGHRDAPKRSVATSPGAIFQRDNHLTPPSFIFLPQSQKRRGPQ
jgi:hypothetical protein